MDLLQPLLSLLRLPLAVLAVLRALYSDYTALLARARAPPGLPVPNPTSAFWQDDPPHPELVDARSPGGPPRTADVVIVGSGITAAAVARTTLRALDRRGELGRDDRDRDRDRDRDGDHHDTSSSSSSSPHGGGSSSSSASRRRDWARVVVLEARQLCSGATGRNGGHIKASPHETFHALRTRRGLSAAAAARLCAFQLGHVAALGAVAREAELEEEEEEDGVGGGGGGVAAAAAAGSSSEFREVRTVDVAVGAAAADRLRAQVAAFLPHRPPGFDMVWHEGGEGEEGQEEELRRRFGVAPGGKSNVVAAVEYPAGAMWPYRFVTSLWRRLLDRFPGSLCLETGTAVTAVTITNSHDDDDDERYPYVVSTTRGQVRARHVVHATNAFASQLVPGLRGRGTGALCHMTAQRPGRAFPGDDEGRRSWSVVYEQGFDYITQRPREKVGQDGDAGGGGELMIGGGLFQSGKQGMDMIGDYDDSKTDALTLMHLEGTMPTVFDWGAEAQGGSRMIKAWTGLVGFSGDMLPLVGRLDPRLTGRKVRDSHGHGSGNGKIMGKADMVRPGEWIAAYFCGDGMVWAWLCGTAVGVMLAGSEEEDLPEEPGRPAGRLAEWFPPELYATWSRVQRLDVADLADEF